jgi:hypothetical protein
MTSEHARPACFTVHSLAHLRAVLETAGSRPVTILSGPIASAYAGYTWFAALVREASAEFPRANFTAILDCGDRAGDALGALDAGVTDVIFTGHPDAARRLNQIADATGARIISERPVSMDLLNLRDPAYAVRAYFETGSN